MVKSSKHSIFSIFVISAFACCVGYALFFYFASYLRSFHLSIPLENYTEWAKQDAGQFKGLESYALYILMFIDLAVSYILILTIDNIKNNIFRKIVIYMLLCVSIFYFVKIGFTVPVNSIFSDFLKDFKLVLVILLITLLLVLINCSWPVVVAAVIGILLYMISFQITELYHMHDYEYILSPALRMIQGAPLSEIYFQYDLFLSFLAYIWMKLGLHFNSFQYLGMASTFVLFFGSYLFSKKIFNDKNLSVFMIVSMVLWRFYANIVDPTALFQISPLRLDLWLILLAIVYFFGLNSWVVGITLALMIFFMKTFGIIYSLAYVELIGLFFVIDLIRVIKKQPFNAPAVNHEISAFLKNNWLNLCMILAAYVVNLIVFKKAGLETAALFMKFGVNFLQIQANSFYWYVPVIFCALIFMLYDMRKNISRNYMINGVFLVFLAIGNSLYFFGRSHEHNIINISAILILCIFVLIDLICLKFSKKLGGEQGWRESAVNMSKVVLPLLVIAVLAYSYSERITRKFNTQVSNYQHHVKIEGYGEGSMDLKLVRELTNNSDKVYFCSVTQSFLWYYYGKYKMVGYYNPFSSWMFKDELVKFLEKLLNEDYYLIIDSPHGGNIKELLTYDTCKESNGLTCLHMTRVTQAVTANETAKEEKTGDKGGR